MLRLTVNILFKNNPQQVYFTPRYKALEYPFNIQCCQTRGLWVGCSFASL